VQCVPACSSEPFARSLPAAGFIDGEVLYWYVTSRGGTDRILYIRPDSPVATIVAIPGGDGTLLLQGDYSHR
jgi:hypothetical protein